MIENEKIKPFAISYEEIEKYYKDKGYGVYYDAEYKNLDTTANKNTNKYIKDDTIHSYSEPFVSIPINGNFIKFYFDHFRSRGIYISTSIDKTEKNDKNFELAISNSYELRIKKYDEYAIFSMGMNNDNKRLQMLFTSDFDDEAIEGYRKETEKGNLSPQFFKIINNTAQITRLSNKTEYDKIERLINDCFNQ